MNNTDKVVDKFAEIWKKYPNMRFGQMLMCILSTKDQEEFMYFIENDKLLKIMEEMDNNESEL